MRVSAHWVRFLAGDGRTGFGILDAGWVLEHDGDMFGAPRPSGAAISRADVRLLPPCMPTKIVALWNNFNALAAKLGKAVPAHPLFFIKPGTSVIGPDVPIERPAGYAGKILYEGELGVVIGRRCRNVPVEAAADYIFGYTCVNDVTAADILAENSDFPQWCRSKGYDTFGCLGPLIATDCDWSRARVITRLNGVERQNYLLADMIFPPPELVSRISHDLTLLPGDIIACGTSLGVGSIKDGARVEISIDGIGTLNNPLGAE